MAMSATFPREIGALPEIFALIDSFFITESIDPERRFPIDLAVEEIFTNLVKYNPQGHGGIDVSLSLQDGELKMALTDSDCAPFDISDAPPVDIDAPIAERKRGGLGIHLVKKMMDRVGYEHERRKGTITLYKRVG